MYSPGNMQTSFLILDLNLEVYCRIEGHAKSHNSWVTEGVDATK